MTKSGLGVCRYAAYCRARCTGAMYDYLEQFKDNHTLRLCSDSRDRKPLRLIAATGIGYLEGK